MSIFTAFVVLVFGYENSLNIHAQIGEVIKNADNCVAELDGEALRLATALGFPLVAVLGVLTISTVKAATTVNQRLALAILLEGLGYLGMNERGNLGKATLAALPPTMSDRVFVYLSCVIVDRYSFFLLFFVFRFGLINTPSFR